MSDIVERLRQRQEWTRAGERERLCEEAADEIERLRAVLMRLLPYAPQCGRSSGRLPDPQPRSCAGEARVIQLVALLRNDPWLPERLRSLCKRLLEDWYREDLENRYREDARALEAVAKVRK